MTKLLSKLREEFHIIKKSSKSDTERVIRRRMAVEKLRTENYLSHYVFNMVETTAAKILGLTIIVLNILNLFLNLYVNIVFPSLFLISLLFYRWYSIEKNNKDRLRIEVHKIRKVFNSIDRNQKLPRELVEWYFESEKFLKDLSES